MDAVRLLKPSVPGLGLLFAIPNGGDRHPAVAVKLQKEGVRPGVSDYFLPVARGGWFGLFIELKSMEGDATAKQLEFAREVRQQGYAVVFRRGSEAALAAILAYLAGTLETQPGERHEEGIQAADESPADDARRLGHAAARASDEGAEDAGQEAGPLKRKARRVPGSREKVRR